MNDGAERALAEALERLTDARTLSPAQAEAVRLEFVTALARTALPDVATPNVATPNVATPNVATPDVATGRPAAATPGRADEDDLSWASALREVGGYLGASLVVAAAIALVGPDWSRRSTLVQVLILAGPAAVMLVAAYLVASGTPTGWLATPSGPRRRLVSVLVLASGVLIGGTAGTLTRHDPSVRAVPLALLVIWGVGYLLIHGDLLHLATGAALTWAVMALLPNQRPHLTLIGVTLVIIGVAWAALSVSGWRVRLRERELGIVVAGVMAFIGAELVVVSDVKWLGYVLLAAIAAAGLAGYLRIHDLTALVVGALVLAVVVPQAVIDYTQGALGAAGALLVSGLSIVAASSLGLRLRRVAR